MSSSVSTRTTSGRAGRDYVSLRATGDERSTRREERKENATETYNNNATTALYVKY